MSKDLDPVENNNKKLIGKARTVKEMAFALSNNTDYEASKDASKIYNHLLKLELAITRSFVCPYNACIIKKNKEAR